LSKKESPPGKGFPVLPENTVSAYETVTVTPPAVVYMKGPALTLPTTVPSPKGVMLGTTLPPGGSGVAWAREVMASSPTQAARAMNELFLIEATSSEC
jgi:hypothetical protein